MRTLRMSLLGLAAMALVLVPAQAGASNDPSFKDQWSLARIGAEQAWSRTTGAGIRSGSWTPGSTSTTRTSRARSWRRPPAQAGWRPGQVQGRRSGRPGPRHPRQRHRRRRTGQREGCGRCGSRRPAGRGQGAQRFGDGVRSRRHRRHQMGGGQRGQDREPVARRSGAAHQCADHRENELKEGVDYVWGKGAIPVIAAGNSNTAGLGLEGANFGDMNAVIVGATGPDDSPSTYSTSTGAAKWAVVAPGGAGSTTKKSDDIYSTFWMSDKKNAYTYLAGTSMAAPHVSGGARHPAGPGLQPAGQG